MGNVDGLNDGNFDGRIYITKYINFPEPVTIQALRVHAETFDGVDQSLVLSVYGENGTACDYTDLVSDGDNVISLDKHGDEKIIKFQIGTVLNNGFVTEMEFFGENLKPSITGLSVSEVTDVTTTLSWTNPVHPNFEGVEVFKDGNLVYKGANETYKVSNLEDNTIYNYEVYSCFSDGLRGNVKSVSAKTLEIYEVLDVSDLQVNSEKTSIRFDWLNWAHLKFDHVDIYRDEIFLTSVSDAFYIDDSLEVDKAYNYKFITVDVDGIKSTGLLMAARTKSDLVPPGEITGLNTTSAESSISFTWTNPLDEDFDHVNIYRDNNLLKGLSTVSFEDDFLLLDTAYSYSLKTVDTYGNESTGIDIQVRTLGKTESLTLLFTNRLDKISPNDILKYTFSNEIQSVDIDSNFSFEKALSNRDLDITLIDNVVDDVVNVTLTVTDIENQVYVKEFSYLTISSENMDLNKSLNFQWFTLFVYELVSKIRESVVIIIVSTLVLLALVVGAFWLLGLSKKIIKKSK